MEKWKWEETLQATKRKTFVFPSSAKRPRNIYIYIMAAAVRLLRFCVHAVLFARRFGSRGSVRTAVRFERFIALTGSAGSVLGSSLFVLFRHVMRFGSVRLSMFLFGGSVRFACACLFGGSVRLGSTQ